MTAEELLKKKREADAKRKAELEANKGSEADPNDEVPASFSISGGKVFLTDKGLEGVTDGSLSLKVEKDDKGASFLAGLEVPGESETVIKLAGQVAALTAEKAEAQASVDTLLVTIEKLTPIISASVSQMSIALGGAAIDTKDLGLEALVALHTSKEVEFKAKFPNGQVAASHHSDKDTDTRSKSAEPDPEFARRVAATRGAV